MSISRERRRGPASYGPAANWPEGPFPQAADAGTRRAVQAAARIAFEVKRARGGRDWSQATLASQAGLSRSSISRLESGTGWVDLNVMIRVLNALDLELWVIDPAYPPQELLQKLGRDPR